MTDQQPEIESQEPVFKNVYQLTKHLKTRGFKVSKSKSDRDKKAGILRVQKDGTITPTDARAYALTLKKEGPSPIDLEKHNKKKADEELKGLMLDNEKKQFALDRERGKYIPKDKFEMEMSTRAAFLEAGLKNLAYSRVPELIRLAGGKEEKTNLVSDIWVEDIDNLINEYSTLNKFQVDFTE